MIKYRLRPRAHRELIPDLLHARGIFGTDAMARFLSPQFERDSHDPFLLPDMAVAVERILLAKKHNEVVAVWSDYDCDGIPGGVMLAEFLRTLGLSVTHYIPHRHKEGYGLNNEGLEELALGGTKLIITVDLGTTDVDAVAFAKQKGIDIIITDHHLVPKEELSGQKSGRPGDGNPRTFGKAILPQAFALINPKRPDSKYPFDGLCGAGVAWKLVQAVLQKVRASGQPFDYSQGKEKWLLDLVALGTLSDMVPLVGENRMLARYGLVVMQKNRRPGLAALLSMLRINARTVSEDDIGFMLAPRINAASRMDSPAVAARLLATHDAEEAGALARQLNQINDKRKVLVSTTVREVNKRLAASEPHKSPLIVMGSPHWRPGILGLVAGKLADTHSKTVFLWGREGGDVIRGSCRSGGGMNVVELMQKAGDIFEHCGGHAASGGFSVLEERVHELGARLLAAYMLMAARSPAGEEMVIDRELDLAEVAHAHRDLVQLAPFGMQNAKPLFLLPRVSVAKVRMFGKASDHMELQLTGTDTTVAGVSFFSNSGSFSKPVVEGMCADIVGHVEADWRGGPRLRVVDVI